MRRKICTLGSAACRIIAWFGSFSLQKGIMNVSFGLQYGSIEYQPAIWLAVNVSGVLQHEPVPSAFASRLTAQCHHFLKKNRHGTFGSSSCHCPPINGDGLPHLRQDRAHHQQRWHWGQLLCRRLRRRLQLVLVRRRRSCPLLLRAVSQQELPPRVLRPSWQPVQNCTLLQLSRRLV